MAASGDGDRTVVGPEVVMSPVKENHFVSVITLFLYTSAFCTLLLRLLGQLIGKCHHVTALLHAHCAVGGYQRRSIFSN